MKFSPAVAWAAVAGDEAAEVEADEVAAAQRGPEAVVVAAARFEAAVAEGAATAAGGRPPVSRRR